MEAHGDGAFVGGEVFGAGEAFDHGAEAAQAARRGFLHGHGAREVGETETAVGARPAVGGEDVIRAAGVVAERFRRPRAEKNGAGRGEVAQHRARLAHLQDQVLRRIAVGDFDSLGARGGEEHAALLQRAEGDCAAWESGELAVELALHLRREARGESHEHDLRVGAVLGLREQVRGDEGRVGRGVGDDHDLRRSGG